MAPGRYRMMPWFKTGCNHHKNHTKQCRSAPHGQGFNAGYPVRTYRHNCHGAYSTTLPFQMKSGTGKYKSQHGNVAVNKGYTGSFPESTFRQCKQNRRVNKNYKQIGIYKSIPQKKQKLVAYLPEFKAVHRRNLSPVTLRNTSSRVASPECIVSRSFVFVALEQFDKITI